MVMYTMNIYSVYDAKADAYLLPFFFKQDAMAIRVFSDLINQDKHQFSLHPGDYTLFAIGTFDETTGKIEDILAGSLGNGVEFIQSTPLGEQYGPQIQPKPNG